ncbi:WhiB family transcriptional regulator, partial [Nocardia acidivorans]|uniref:WhiB family transcriptional regulator n=1 Tax=Nocardia acidivorans TaxID=404580 RepID=UPI00157D5BC4
MSWEERGLCTGPGEPIDSWFTAAKDPAHQRAKAICVKQCPVRLECGRAARKTGDRHGIRAGFNLTSSAGVRALVKWL